MSEAPGQITKCCGKNEVLDLGYNHQACVPNPDPPRGPNPMSEWLPPRRISSKQTSRPTGQFNIQYSQFPDICNSSSYYNLHLSPNAPLFTDGTAVTEEGDYKDPLLVNYACIDRNLDLNRTGVEEITWVFVCDYEDIGNRIAIGNPKDLHTGDGGMVVENTFEILPGGDGDKIEECEWEAFRNFYSFLTVASIICLMATTYVYIKVKLTEKMQGKIVLANVLATLFVNLYLLIVYNYENPASNFPTENATNISSYNEVPPSEDLKEIATDSFCVLLGYFGYFTSLTMFSWMSVMCFNLIKTLVKMSLSQGSKKQFIIYCAVGLGCPLLLSLTAGILQVRYKLPH